MTFDEFFREATGYMPYAYQQRITEEGLPDVIEVPTGAGKTLSVLIPWMYRLLHADNTTRANTPLRLVFALPLRTLTKQTENVVRETLNNLNLTDRVAVHVLMGGRLGHADQMQWRMSLDKPTVVIGTIDCVVSRALMRGYGSSRSAYPIEFALITNDAHIVIDEVQLGAQATRTLRQINGLRETLPPSPRPTGLTCMSATLDPQILNSVNARFTPDTAHVVRLTDDDITGHLNQRMTSTRRVTELNSTKPQDLADTATELHQTGTLTLVVVNTVKTATDIAKKLHKQHRDDDSPDIHLVHSRFMPHHREQKSDAITSKLPPAGRIVVSTQVVEAGIDLDARILITEVAPWSSIVQRAGRCNRRGEITDAQLIWCDSLTSLKSQPYDETDLTTAAETLRQLENVEVTATELPGMVEPAYPDLNTLRRKDFESFFDTSPDLSGNDVDVSLYIRDTDPLDLTIAWIDTESPNDDTFALPDPAVRCPITPSGLNDLRKTDAILWIFDATADTWQRLSRTTHVQPQDLILTPTKTGWYSAELGFGNHTKTPVDVPRPDDANTVANPPDGSGMSDENGSINQHTWQTLGDHLRETKDESENLTNQLGDALPNDVQHAIITAAYLHDCGKAHPWWQSALRRAAHTDSSLPDDVLYAKSGTPPRAPQENQKPQETKNEKKAAPRRFVVHDDKGNTRAGFRHELVSAQMLDTDSGTALLTTLGVAPELHDLVKYLVVAHHGRIRVAARNPLTDGTTGTDFFGLRPDDTLPALDIGDGWAIDAGTVDLSIFYGGDANWSERVRHLLQSYGPFGVAYFETIVRIADWRSSAAHAARGVQQ